MKKLNNKGFAISGIVYSLLLLFVILLYAILSILANRKVILDQTKKDLLDEINGESETGSSDNSGGGIIDYVFADLMAQYDGTRDFKNNKWIDLTGNGNDGAVKGFDKSSGKRGDAIYFDGSDDYIEIPRMVSKDFTIEIVFSTTKGTGTSNDWTTSMGLLDARKSAISKDFGIGLNKAGKVVAGQGNGTTSSFTYSQDGFNNGNIQSTTFVREATSGKMTLYANGSFEHSLTISNVDLDSATVMHIGRVQAGRNYYNGNIYSVRIYDTALKEDDIKANYEVDKKRFKMEENPSPAPKS